jgi:hypothetical protein
MTTFPVSLLASVRFTPPDGAAVDSITGKAADWPDTIAVLFGNMIVAEPSTVTVAVASAISGALARMTAEPGATPVTGTLAAVAVAPKITVGGTVATLGLLDDRATVSPF